VNSAVLAVDWREKVAHALRIQEETRQRRDADPVAIVRYRPLKVQTPTLRASRW
jgi:hypothetical protein